MQTTTKLERLRHHIAAGQWRQALKLAAAFPRLGAQRDAIQRGHQGFCHPGWAQQMGRDPGADIAAGIAALRARYEPTR